jgi:hypothetical protein
MNIGNTPGDLGIMAARDEAHHQQQPTFWLVTRPTKDSEVADIYFETDWVRLRELFLGGLDPTTIYRSYPVRVEARNVAQSLLDVRDGKLDPSMVRP